MQTNCSLFKQKKALDVDSRAIQQIIFIGKTKSTVANTRVIIYYILQQSKETILKFSKGTTKVLGITQMAEYSKVNIKLTDRQLKRLQTTVEDKARATLRMSLKIFDGNAS